MCFPESAATVVYAALLEFCGMLRNQTEPSISGVVVSAPVAEMANFVVHPALALIMFQVEPVPWSNINTSTVSERVPKACVVIFSSFNTDPEDVRFLPVVSVAFVLFM